MKTRVAIVCVTIFLATVCRARPIPYWSYEMLYEKADLVAIVELVSLSESKEKLLGHGDPEQFIGRNAFLRVGVVLKGDPKTKQVNLVHFVPGKFDKPYVTFFLDFTDSSKHQYMIFLMKDENENFVPVSGHFDASASVKKIEKDDFSSIRLTK